MNGITPASIPAFTSLAELLHWRAQQQGDQLAYIFLADGATQEERITYRALNARARTIGAFLQKRAPAGERVLLLYPPGLDFICAFFGCLYAGVVAIPAYPPQRIRADRSLPRIQAIKNDAQPVIALTTTSMLTGAEALFTQMPDICVYATDTLSDEFALQWNAPGVDSATLAFLQYTSGSTGTPKGVMVTHGNLMYNQQIIQTSHNLTHLSTFVSWLPLYHDMGLIGNILQPLYLGALAVLMSPVAFIQRPFRWLQAISRYKAYISGGPNFAYDLCALKITPEQRASLDLSTWQIAFNGSEPVRHETLERFAAMFEPCGFRREAFAPCYGLAEATLIVTGGVVKPSFNHCHVNEVALMHNQVVVQTEADESTRTLVSSGPSWLDQTVVIVDAETCKKCAPGVVGEIWVSGPSVTRGYWGRSDETKYTFEAYLQDTGEGPFLRTGDLGFLYNGELYVTGRLKDMIIIRGRNLYPQDIESTVEQCHELLRSGNGTAFAIEQGGEEQLVIVHEVERRYRATDRDELAETIRQVVGDAHEVQPYAIVFIKTGSLPKTSSGKIQVHLTRQKYLAGELEIAGERHA